MTVNWMALSSPNVSYAHFRTERISLTAAMPLLAIRTCQFRQHTPQLPRTALTFVMTVWPPCAATKSLTLDGGAAAK